MNINNTNKSNNNINTINNNINATNLLNNVLSPEELKELDIRNENRYRTYIASEGVLTSWLRNTIILFMGGITIITFSSIKEKYVLSLLLSLVGIIMGCVAYYEYKDRTQKIKDRNFGGIIIGSYNENVTMWVLLIFIGLFILRSIKVTQKYGLKTIFRIN
jgi:uncharacterized membrane protein YidH (DUF202 family)